MELKQLVLLALQVSIFGFVLGFGLEATVADLAYLLRKPWLVVRSLLSIFVVMPLLAVAMVSWLDFPSNTEIALVALAISPLPPLLPRREAKAGGHHAYGIALIALVSALSIVVTPLAALLIAKSTGHVSVAPTAAIAALMLKMILLPLAVGMTIRAAFPGFARRITAPVSKCVAVLAVLGLVPLLVTAAPAMWARLSEGTLIAMMLFCAIGLAVGHLLARPDDDHSAVLALSTACRHPATALTIAAANFPDERFGATILLYLLVSALVSAPYVAWHRRRTAQQAPAALSTDRLRKP